jgi:hypothetical protein
MRCFVKKNVFEKELVKLVKLKKRGSSISKHFSSGVRDIQKVKNRWYRVYVYITQNNITFIFHVSFGNSSKS